MHDSLHFSPRRMTTSGEWFPLRIYIRRVGSPSALLTAAALSLELLLHQESTVFRPVLLCARAFSYAACQALKEWAIALALRKM